jgi:hypothetical protein
MDRGISFMPVPGSLEGEDLQPLLDYVKARTETKIKNGAIEMRCSQLFDFKFSSNGKDYTAEVTAVFGEIMIRISERSEI